jgi:hypothetical protein
MRFSSLRPGQYTSAHVRALYVADPRAIAMLSGWVENAINCAVQLQKSTGVGNIPVYFAADSNKALQHAISYGRIYMVDVVTPETTVQQDPLHLDKTADWQFRPPSDFFGAFIDLYVMGLSTGVTYGMGGYGRFASLISNNSSNSIVHMSATFSENCIPPPRRRRRSGLHNYFKKKNNDSISNNFVKPMPPANNAFRRSTHVHVIQQNATKRGTSNKFVESLFPTKLEKTETLWDESQKLPKWMKDYFAWHREQRKQITQNNWQSYKYIIMTCLHDDVKCGGASDRLRALPFIVRVAAESNRVILIKWEIPAPLESFLLPPHGGLDWRVPDWMGTLLHSNGIKASSVARLVDVAASNEPIIKARIRSYDHGSEYYNNRGDVAGEGPMSLRQHYRDCWYTFFTPVPVIADIIAEEMIRMDLVPGEFAVAHLRSEYDLEPGRHRDPQQLHNWTLSALNCISGLHPGGPYFFSSDSSDAKKMAIEYGKFRNSRIVTSDIQRFHVDMALSTRVQDPIRFYSTFVDLYLMSMGRCYSYNVGGFGKWANLISGHDFTCNTRYWTDGVNKITAVQELCQWVEGANSDSQTGTAMLQRVHFLDPIDR